MKKIIFLGILTIVLLSGCSNLDKISHTGMCQDSCEYKERFEKDIQHFFGLNPGEYVVECSECSMGRTRHVKARLLVNGESIELYHKEGWCSSGGTDCGWEVSFTSFSEEPNPVYETLKKRYCSALSSKSKLENTPCGEIETFDNSEEVKQECFGGKFEEINGKKKSLTLKQINNRCEDGVKKIEAQSF